MQNSLRLVMGASVLLYLGPLLAGLSGIGWAAVPVFIALFALWLVVMQPAKWPRDLSVWTGQTALAAAAQVAVNALIVVVLFGIGRGIGGVAGFLPHIPAIFPVAVSFLSIPLARLAMNPAKAEGMDGFLDQALAQINVPAARPSDNGSTDEMVAVLLSLPEDSDPMLVADAVDAAMKGSKANARLKQLNAALDTSPAAHRALREAVVLWATDPSRTPAEGLVGAQDVAFQVAGMDPLLLHLFAHRGAALLASQPGLWAGFPQGKLVAQAVNKDQPENLQAALRALAQALDA